MILIDMLGTENYRSDSGSKVLLFPFFFARQNSFTNCALFFYFCSRLLAGEASNTGSFLIFVPLNLDFSSESDINAPTCQRFHK